jgi:diphthamide synthase (EF-2-diphthine--ammonia ligase)
MIAAGLRARLTCINPRKLSSTFVAREFGSALLAQLPADVDPCGERGEFHTFCYAGPMFRSHISIQIAEIVERDGYVFADLVPQEASRSEKCTKNAKSMRTPAP